MTRMLPEQRRPAQRVHGPDLAGLEIDRVINLWRYSSEIVAATVHSRCRGGDGAASSSELALAGIRGVWRLGLRGSGFVGEATRRSRRSSSCLLYATALDPSEWFERVVESIGFFCPFSPCCCCIAGEGSEDQPDGEGFPGHGRAGEWLAADFVIGVAILLPDGIRALAGARPGQAAAVPDSWFPALHGAVPGCYSRSTMCANSQPLMAIWTDDHRLHPNEGSGTATKFVRKPRLFHAFDGGLRQAMDVSLPCRRTAAF